MSCLMPSSRKSSNYGFLIYWKTTQRYYSFSTIPATGFCWGGIADRLPAKEKIKGQQDELEAGIELYFMYDRSNEHHALLDARALFNGFKVKYAGKELTY
ncbi:MAG: hypothetical protein Q8Q76_03385 [Methylotenera sp.]|nr:hypothetical protein [Methylotenera sp.]